jgi:type IV fimbrial biogenesis protein FimT
MMGIKKNIKGFTMVEMIIVVAVVVIMAAVSVPAIHKWVPNQQLRSVANEMYTNIQWAKLNAIRRNETWTITFDPVNLQYQIWDGNGVSVKTTSLAGYSGGIAFGFGEANIEIGGGGTADPITYTADSAAFDSRGMAGAPGYVYLQNNQNRAYAIGNNISGFVMLRRWRGNAWQ